MNYLATNKVLSSALLLCLSMSIPSRADVWRDLTTGCAIVAGIAATVGGVAWLFSESDEQAIKNAESLVNEAQEALESIDRVFCKANVDVCKKYHDELGDLYQLAMEFYEDQRWSVGEFGRSIDCLASRIKNYRNKLQKITDKLHGNYELSPQDRALFGRAKSALSTITLLQNEFTYYQSFWSKNRAYFKTFAAEVKLIEVYGDELGLIAHYSYDPYGFVAAVKPRIINSQRYPFIAYARTIQREMERFVSVYKRASKFRHRYGCAMNLHKQLEWIHNCIVSSAEYQHELARKEQERRDREWRKLERDRINAIKKQTHEMRRQNDLHHSRCCRVCNYRYTCDSCDWLNWCSTCGYEQSCATCDYDLSLNFTIQL